MHKEKILGNPHLKNIASFLIKAEIPTSKNQYFKRIKYQKNRADTKGEIPFFSRTRLCL